MTLGGSWLGPDGSFPAGCPPPRASPGGTLSLGLNSWFNSLRRETGCSDSGQVPSSQCRLWWGPGEQRAPSTDTSHSPPPPRWSNLF